jgi:siroheme synthase
MKDLRTFLSPSRFASLTPANILEIKCEEKMRFKWMATRRKAIDQFVREKTGDPSMTAKGLKEAKKIKSTKEYNWLSSLSIV